MLEKPFSFSYTRIKEEMQMEIHALNEVKQKLQEDIG